MNHLEKELLRRSDTVITVGATLDLEVTVQERQFIYEKLNSVDKVFLKKMLINPNFSFTYGEKYFYPVNDKYFICVPKGARLEKIKNYLPNDSATVVAIIADFNSMRNLLTGYFNIEK